MADDLQRRTMVCPYCGHTCQTTSIGAVYCGPHVASFGPATHPAVRMVERPAHGETSCKTEG